VPASTRRSFASGQEGDRWGVVMKTCPSFCTDCRNKFWRSSSRWSSRSSMPNRGEASICLCKRCHSDSLRARQSIPSSSWIRSDNMFACSENTSPSPQNACPSLLPYTLNILKIDDKSLKVNEILSRISEFLPSIYILSSTGVKLFLNIQQNAKFM
jgi:hypothetical protein